MTADELEMLTNMSAAAGWLPEEIGEGQLGNLNHALKILFHLLRKARPKCNPNDDGGRTAIIECVKAVSIFISFFRPVIEEDLQVPLVLLVNALMALDQNLESPLFKTPETPRSGRSPDSQLRQSIKGVVAAVVQTLRSEAVGLTAAEAHSSVAKELNSLGMKPARGNKGMKARTVRGWCMDVSTDVGCNENAAQTFTIMSKGLENAIQGHAPAQAREILFKALDKVVKATRAADSP